MKAENLLVSFSGGETSAFMAQWISRNLSYKYKRVVYVFANTGLENTETLLFVDKCSDHFNLNVQWIEADVTHEKGIGTGYKFTDFISASRNGEPFEEIIKKYGIPNQKFPHCTRELKLSPIKSFARDWFDGEKYDTAIGIRIDEIDRISSSRIKNRLIYPLCDPSMIPTSKQMVNFYWKNMPFRLMLKGYQGNCITCWKKSDKKLFQIAKENPTAFNFMDLMEQKYMKSNPFFRKNRTAKTILEQSQKWHGKIVDDSIDSNYQIDLLGGESCEVFSECSDPTE